MVVNRVFLDRESPAHQICNTYLSDSHTSSPTFLAPGDDETRVNGRLSSAYARIVPDKSSEEYQTCLKTFEQLIVKAPAWVETKDRIMTIIESLESRRENKDWPGLDKLNGKTIEWTQVATETHNPLEKTVPQPVLAWLRRGFMVDGMDTTNTVVDVAWIPDDRTHVHLYLRTEIPFDYKKSRVSVAKLLDQYDAPPELKKLMTKLPSKSTGDRVQIEISTDPVDILRKSTGQYWHSCESAGGCAETGADYSAGNFTDITAKNAVAIIRKNKDIDMRGDWTGRVMLRSCKDNEDNINVGVEPRVYGDVTLQEPAIRKLKAWLKENGYLGYDYCVTPYEYEGHSDQMRKENLGQEGPIIYGNWRLAVSDIVEKNIAKIRDELDYDGVCRIAYPSPLEKQYYEGNLADLYEKKLRERAEEYDDDGESLITALHQSTFDEVTDCRLNFDPDAYLKWKAGEELFNATLERLKDVFEDEVYLVGAVEVGDANNRQSWSQIHLFAPSCELAYNRSPYLDQSIWPDKMRAVTPLLEQYYAADRESQRYWLKRRIIQELNPWNDWAVAVELLDEETARGPFRTEEIARYCRELDAKKEDKLVSYSYGFTNVGYLDEGRCPIDSPAMEIMAERCKIRQGFDWEWQKGTEVFSSDKEVGNIDERRRAISVIYDKMNYGFITVEEAMPLLREWGVDTDSLAVQKALTKGTTEEERGEYLGERMSSRR